MKPYKVELYIYAESEDQAKKVESAAISFVKQKYTQGTLVTASKLIDALKKFENSIIVNQYFK